jgi:hypothetical protein
MLRHRLATASVLTLAGLAASACGEEAHTTVTEPDGDEQLFTATATVLETPDAPPYLCLGAMTSSLPPTGCGGAEITNWSWDELEDAQSMGGTTWGTYTVVGSYDGERFTLTEPPVQPAERDGSVGEAPTFPTPCQEPAGGWAVVDEATATDEAMSAAIAYAEAQPDHAGTWVDQSINPALRDNDSSDIESAANDPTKLVLNIRFTGDIERHEAELRDIWGGALCVSLAEHTQAELRDIQNELHSGLSGVLMSGVDSVTGMVDIQLVFDDGSLQAELDERYGSGVVRISARLQPLD